jgi:hypothetical protein
VLNLSINHVVLECSVELPLSQVYFHVVPYDNWYIACANATATFCTYTSKQPKDNKTLTLPHQNNQKTTKPRSEVFETKSFSKQTKIWLNLRHAQIQHATASYHFYSLTKTKTLTLPHPFQRHISKLIWCTSFYFRCMSA